MSGARILGAFQEITARLRFPQLFLLTLVLFLGDLLVPDLIPLVDEIMLGLLTLMLGMWKQKKSGGNPVREHLRGETIEVSAVPVSSQESDSELDT